MDQCLLRKDNKSVEFRFVDETGIYRWRHEVAVKVLLVNQGFIISVDPPGGQDDFTSNLSSRPQPEEIIKALLVIDRLSVFTVCGDEIDEINQIISALRGDLDEEKVQQLAAKCSLGEKEFMDIVYGSVAPVELFELVEEYSSDRGEAFFSSIDCMTQFGGVFGNDTDLLDAIIERHVYS